VKAVDKNGELIPVMLCLDEYFESGKRFFMANFCVSDKERSAAGFSGLSVEELDFDDDDDTASDASTSSAAPKADSRAGLRIHSGVLKKRSMFGRWKASWFVATKDHLAEYATEKSTKPRARYQYKGMRLGLDASSLMAKPNCFSISTSEQETYFFQAASDTDMHAWTDALARFVESQNTTMNIEWFNSATVCSDTTGKIIAVNTNAEEFFGYERCELLGENVTVFMLPEIASHHAGFIKRYLKSGQRRLMGAFFALASSSAVLCAHW
jgi:PH domain/PAS domain